MKCIPAPAHAYRISLPVDPSTPCACCAIRYNILVTSAGGVPRPGAGWAPLSPTAPRPAAWRSLHAFLASPSTPSDV